MLHPEKFVKLGIDPPKGVLCYGPPGTGKTLLARAVANRTDACFIRVIGSELVQKYVGEGARMVRELFQVKNAPDLLNFGNSFHEINHLPKIFSCRWLVQRRHALCFLMKLMRLEVHDLTMVLVVITRFNAPCLKL